MERVSDATQAALRAKANSKRTDMTTETTTASATRPLPAIGKWRPAGVLRDGWQILKVDQFEQTGVEEWLTIKRAIQITAPLRVVSLQLSDGDRYGCPADRASGYEFFTRTHAEIERAASAAAAVAAVADSTPSVTEG